jgi:hypothetical protein
MSILDGVSRYLRGERAQGALQLTSLRGVVHIQLPNAVSLSEPSVRPEMYPYSGGDWELVLHQLQTISFLRINYVSR